MSEHTSWCTDHSDSGCRTAKVLAGNAGVRLVQHARESRPTLMVTHSVSVEGTGWPVLLLPFSEAADFTALMRALKHPKIANSVEQVLRDAGATLTEEYGRQHWEVPG